MFPDPRQPANPNTRQTQENSTANSSSGVFLPSGNEGRICANPSQSEKTPDICGRNLKILKREQSNLSMLTILELHRANDLGVTSVIMAQNHPNVHKLGSCGHRSCHSAKISGTLSSKLFFSSPFSFSSFAASFNESARSNIALPPTSASS